MEEYRKLSKNLWTRLQVAHLGKILFTLEIVAVVIMTISVFANLLVPLYWLLILVYYALLFCAMMFSLFSLLAVPEFRAMWAFEETNQGGAFLTQFASAMNKSWPYTIALTIVLAVGAIVCLCFDFRKKHTAQIVVSSVAIVFALIAMIVRLVMLGGVA